MKNQPKTLHSAKIRLTKCENLLWKCYSFLQESYGCDGNDFLTGSMGGFMSQEKLSTVGRELKIKLRKVFERKGIK